MKLWWFIIGCPLFLLINEPFSNALEWTLDSLPNDEYKLIDDSHKSRWRPKREAPVIQEYIAEIEISFSDPAFLESLKLVLKELNAAHAFNTSDAINITSIAVTTECSLNASAVKCTCEAGYLWPLETCSGSANCTSSPQVCDCINTFPLDGAYCQLMPPGTMVTPTPTSIVMSTLPVVNITTSKPFTTLVPMITVTTVPTTTTVPTAMPSTTTTTPTTTVPTAMPSTTTTTPTTTMPTAMPSTTTTTPTTTMPTAVPSTTTTTPTTTVTTTARIPNTGSKTANITMALRLNEHFTVELNNRSSAKYIKYKKDLEEAFTNGYRNLPGFQSVNITGFWNGSVMAEYYIIADAENQSAIDEVNGKVKENLTAKGEFTISDSAFFRVLYDQSNITVSPEALFQGQTMIMTCTTISNSTSAVWTYNATINLTSYSTTTLQKGLSVSVLNITNISPANSGEYTCRLTDGSLVYVAKHVVSVSSIRTTFNANNDILCNGNATVVYSMCTDGNRILIDCSCKPRGAINITGSNHIDGKCFNFSVAADISLCPANMSGSQTNYICECKSAGWLLTSDKTAVTFIRKANVKITNGSITVSMGDTILLFCESDVPNLAITWTFISSRGGTAALQAYYAANSANSSVLNILNVDMSWEGTFTCTGHQAIYSSSDSASVTVLPLPALQFINPSPLTKALSCKSSVQLNCCVSDGHTYFLQLKVTGTSSSLKDTPTRSTCIEYNYLYDCVPEETVIQCIVNNTKRIVRKNITLTKAPDHPACNEEPQGAGTNLQTILLQCQEPLKGNITFICKPPHWEVYTNSCITEVLNSLLVNSTNFASGSVADISSFLVTLDSTVTKEPDTRNTFAAVNTVVGILETLSKVAKSVDVDMMDHFLRTADVIVKDKQTWQSENQTTRIDGGSRLLHSTEDFSKALTIDNGSISKDIGNIQLKGIVVKENETQAYSQNFSFTNASGMVSIPSEVLQTLVNASVNTTVISIAYSKLSDILTAENNQTVNGLIISTVVNDGQNTASARKNVPISMTFQKINSLLANPSCVFWNFTHNVTGGWDSEGCRATNESEENVTCTCDHLTSFSMLMSSSYNPPVDPNGTVVPNPNDPVNDPVETYITYIGIGISLGSLLLCLIIEILVWKSVTKNKTSYMRHVCLVNIAVSLMIADIWFIIGANLDDILVKDKTSSTLDACDTATFFTHFFYLSLFFWMLTMGLILFYRLVYVLHDMSKTALLATAFLLGYVCPLIISTITIASTRSQNNSSRLVNYYRQGNSCWLNIQNTNAFLAFVVPALTIVAVNFIILAVVIVKLMRPTVGDKPRQEEKSTLIKIAKSVAILTPLLGLTWGFGIGLLISNNRGLRITFSTLNSLQGFFILVFGCLTDAKIRDALLRQFSLSRWASQLTKSTTLSSTTRSTPNIKPTSHLFGKRGAYSLSSPSASSSSEVPSSVYSALN